jgi:Domain of unknown function (DUF4430)
VALRNVKKLLALGGASAALALISAGAALASAVTVRVEGLKRTLLAPTVVHPRPGSITRYGAPKDACPSPSAQGALDVATHHRWVGKWSTQFGPEYEITSILGEAHSFTSKYFWEIFVNNVASSAGACEIKLHRGDQLLFAAVPDSGIAYPLAIESLRSATVGHAFTVKVVYFTGPGTAKPLGGATVSAAGRSGRTDGHGTVSLTPSHAGRFVLHAEHAGYVRAAPVTLTVS